MMLISETASRRKILRAGALTLLAPLWGRADSAVTGDDRARMKTLAAWTGLSLGGPNPGPYGSEIFDTRTGVSFARAINTVGPDHDPSAHAEVNAIRQATKKLGMGSLRGYTLYTTCEPCGMCMSCCLWARVDRVVYGATFHDAARYGHEIMISSAEIARRSDMHCEVVGPVEREACLQLFTDPRMQKVFATWKW